MRLLCALVLVLASSPVRAEEWRGAARVVDGDTVIIWGTRLRLISLDAPEGRQTCRNAKQVEYDCGMSATKELERLIGGKEISCSGEKRDRYGRPLVVCMVGGLNLNAEFVRSGWAISFLGRDYEREEAEARTAKRGLWEGTFLTPQEWRRESRKGQTPRS